MKRESDRIYRITREGIRALESQRSVPQWYRSILAAAKGESTASQICDRVGGESRKQIVTWLHQLETLGFVEVMDADPVHSAEESTTSFGFDVLLARQRAA